MFQLFNELESEPMQQQLEGIEIVNYMIILQFGFVTNASTGPIEQ